MAAASVGPMDPALSARDHKGSHEADEADDDDDDDASRSLVALASEHPSVSISNLRNQRANLKLEAKLALFHAGKLFHCSDPNCKNTGDPTKGKGQCGANRAHKSNQRWDKSNPVKSEADIDAW